MLPAVLSAAPPEPEAASLGVVLRLLPWGSVPWREAAMLAAPVLGTAAVRLLGRAGDDA